MSSISGIAGVLGTFLLAFLGSWAILAPFFSPGREGRREGYAEGGEEHTSLKLALVEKEKVFSSLEELEEDYRLGRVSEEAYAELKSSLMQEAAACIEQIDQLDDESQPREGAKRQVLS